MLRQHSAGNFTISHYGLCSPLFPNSVRHLAFFIDSNSIELSARLKNSSNTSSFPSIRFIIPITVRYVLFPIFYCLFLLAFFGLVLFLHSSLLHSFFPVPEHVLSFYLQYFIEVFFSRVFPSPKKSDLCFFSEFCYLFNRVRSTTIVCTLLKTIDIQFTSKTK